MKDIIIHTFTVSNGYRNIPYKQTIMYSPFGSSPYTTNNLDKLKHPNIFYKNCIFLRDKTTDRQLSSSTERIVQPTVWRGSKGFGKERGSALGIPFGPKYLFPSLRISPTKVFPTASGSPRWKFQRVKSSSDLHHMIFGSISAGQWCADRWFIKANEYYRLFTNLLKKKNIIEFSVFIVRTVHLFHYLQSSFCYQIYYAYQLFTIFFCMNQCMQKLRDKENTRKSR